MYWCTYSEMGNANTHTHKRTDKYLTCGAIVLYLVTNNNWSQNCDKTENVCILNDEHSNFSINASTTYSTRYTLFVNRLHSGSGYVLVFACQFSMHIYSTLYLIHSSSVFFPRNHCKQIYFLEFYIPNASARIPI